MAAAQSSPGPLIDVRNPPRFTAAAVQAAPVFLDTAATIDKAVALIAEAASNGASLVVFPEVFVAGYPYWNWTMTPVQGSPWFERLYRSAIDIPGTEVDLLRDAARAHGVVLVIGVNERGRHGLGTLHNSLVLIGPHGELLGIHRKLVPTWAEKLTWTGGDASTLRVHRTPIGPIGALACGENTNTLARFALLAQGELIHTANYISLPVAPADYDMAEAIAVRTAAHSFEGKVFSVVSCSSLSAEIVDAVAGDDEETRKLFARPHSALSGIFGPDGMPVSEPLVDDEGIVYGKIDLARCIQPKQMHDITGHYNRFDAFRLHVDNRPQPPVTFASDVPVPPLVSEEEA
ncbi:carbon-nitrogen hydrolase family protein [Streptomyces rhizosphaericus]|uniref:Carbon-nitrogen hydrolase family protein n=1 Tax=Streptomyces rhizosphaericus TaxID=114699 RepID=A0A6G4AT29_9ACTN|nr:carbon-nitrogen hydrolase family protein [Streptomyces rhizosphaericus]NEW76636.1 carbon-nitrogen hydrolase family protein [Streptomyces rhizosphaericus]